MLGSMPFVVSAVLIALVWLFFVVVVVAACRMAGRSDAEQISFDTGDELAAPPAPALKARAARPHAARYAARS